MAQTDRNTVYKWFLTKLKPKQAHFHSLLDSIWFKNEKIPINKIQGIGELMVGKADAELLDNHINDGDKHITSIEREKLENLVNYELPQVLANIEQINVNNWNESINKKITDFSITGDDYKVAEITLQDGTVLKANLGNIINKTDDLLKIPNENSYNKSIDDLNDLIAEGIYKVKSTCLNNPTGNSGTLINLNSGAQNYKTQLLKIVNSDNVDRMMIRHYMPLKSSWSEWKEFYHTGNLNPVKITSVPASETSEGNVGDVAFTDTHMYICYSNNKWSKINHHWHAYG